MPAKAPYNFVPAPEWNEVFKPEWAEQVSHDLPFSDGESGEIEIEIEAETPIFIRSGKEPKGEIQHFPSFMQDGEKKYYIPGSSIKGMVRNVLEIMSRSMLNPEFVADDRFFYRDLRNGSYYKNRFSTERVKAGWLSIDHDGKWVIKPTKWCFIHHMDIDNEFGTSFRQTFLRGPNNQRFNDVYRKSFGKYEQLYKYELNFNIEVIQGHNYTRRLAIPNVNGSETGTIVCTGQPGLRIEEGHPRTHRGKVHEFVFYNPQDNLITLSEKVIKNFKFSNSDQDSDVENDWKRFRKDLFDGYEIPIFYQMTQNEIVHFGLAYLYKLPYEQSIHDLNPIKGYKNNYQRGIPETYDLAKTIFGNASKNESLKGRVSISHAICSHAVINHPEVNLVLGQPKASYHPHYLADSESIAAYDNPNGKLAGFKKYFNRENAVLLDLAPAGDNDRIRTRFKPLGAGSTFHCIIRYHNLRKCELGALLSALTFNGNSHLLKHQLGGAKPFGFGKIALKMHKFKTTDATSSVESLMEKFKKCIDNPSQPWLTGRNILALYAMSSGKNGNQELNYPSLGEYQRKESILTTPIYKK